MPNKIVSELMKEVVDLRIAVGSLKTDVKALSKIVYLGVGVGTTASAGIIVQIVAHMWK